MRSLGKIKDLYILGYRITYGYRQLELVLPERIIVQPRASFFIPIP